MTGAQSFATFEAILNNATTLNTGFVVLEHDLYAQTVDLAIGYTLPAAQSFTPALTVSLALHLPTVAYSMWCYSSILLATATGSQPRTFTVKVIKINHSLMPTPPLPAVLVVVLVVPQKPAVLR